jgi:hypothetical protein
MLLLSLRGDGGGASPKVVEPELPRKASSESRATVPQTDTGGRVEYTKANGGTLVKELGITTP